MIAQSVGCCGLAVLREWNPRSLAELVPNELREEVGNECLVLASLITLLAWEAGGATVSWCPQPPGRVPARVAAQKRGRDLRKCRGPQGGLR